MRSLLTPIVLFWLAAFAYADLPICAPNSPERIRKRPDVRLCKNAEEIQAVLDQAWAERDEVVLQTGKYFIKTPLVARCTIRGIGAARLQWTGEETDHYMLSQIGTTGTLYRPHLSGINFHGSNKARGLYVDNVHSATIEDVILFACRGMAMKVERGWNLHLKNIRASHSKDARAFDLQGFSASTIDGMTLARMTTNDGPMVSFTGGCTIHQLGLATCDSGKHPAIRIHTTWGTHLSLLHTEQLKCSSILHIDNSFGVVAEHLYHWQEQKHVIPYAIRVTDSEACVVRRVKAYNVSEAIVYFDQYSGDHACTAPRELIREGYGQDAGTQPKHIVRQRGRGAKGD